MPPMKGVVELITADGHRCSGVMISSKAVLTSARCLRPYMPPGATSMGPTELFYVNVTGFHYGAQIWTKHCVDSPHGQPDYQCQGPPKSLNYYVYSATETPGDASNDLGLVTAPFYDWHYHDDFADIYMQATRPAGENYLQIYGYGQTSAGEEGGIYRTGQMRVSSMGSKVLKFYPDSVSAQTCWGDEGAPFAIRPSVSGSAHEVVAIHAFRSSINYTTACSQPGTTVTDHATRIADKMPWIESIIGPCASLKDSAGRPIKRCWQMHSCSEPPRQGAEWNGCYGSGCSACANLLTQYPNYFRNHPNCSRNTACTGKTPIACSWNCPKPVEGDK
jgi:hypothetical protein